MTANLHAATEVMEMTSNWPRDEYDAAFNRWWNLAERLAAFRLLHDPTPTRTS
jgi:hypothetical protein